jgi:pimeloyl-ACP methyl ester carboxylesterase
VQLPLQLEIIREIMKGLRHKDFSCIQQKYKEIIFVTHSYGSLVGRAMAMQYPKDGADAYILTATSTDLVGIAAAGADFHPRAAKITDPTHFGNLPPAYVSMDPNALHDIVYALPEDYDAGMLALDKQQPHVFAIGELATNKPNLTSTFEGPVMYLTGRTDPIVCDKAGNITISLPDCGVGKTSNPGLSVSRFPKAKPFGVYVPDRTGHNLNLHYSAPESFGAAHEFLDLAGF